VPNGVKSGKINGTANSLYYKELEYDGKPVEDPDSPVKKPDGPKRPIMTRIPKRGK
jgi:hypothetical protein